MQRTRFVILLLALLPLKEIRIAVEVNCNAKGEWGQQPTLLGKTERAGHPTPLMRAATKGDSATVKALLDRGADVNANAERLTVREENRGASCLIR